MSFESNAQKLKSYEIGNIVNENFPHVVVAAFNIPHAQGSDPYVVFVPESCVQDYLESMRSRTIKSSVDTVVTLGMELSHLCVAVRMDGMFDGDKYPITNKAYKISPHVTRLREYLKDFGFGSHPFADARSSFVDGHLLGIDKKGQPTILLTAHDNLTSAYNVIDLAEMVPPMPAGQPISSARQPEARL